MNMETSASSRRTTAQQFCTLLEYMESHGDLTKINPGIQGRLRSEALWQELTDTLNSSDGGAFKTKAKWRKVWADWKQKTKKKALDMRKHAAGTGGGPRSQIKLSEIEERLLALIGEVAVVGLPGVEEQGLAGPSRAVAPSPPSPYPDPLPFVQSQSFLCEALIDEIVPPSRLPQCSTPIPPPTPSHPVARNLPPLPPPPLSLASSPSRPVGRVRRRRAQTPFERATTEFVNIEERRLRVEEMRARNEARHIDVMQSMVGTMNRMEQLMQAWFDNYVGRDITVRLDTD